MEDESGRSSAAPDELCSRCRHDGARGSWTFRSVNENTRLVHALCHTFSSRFVLLHRDSAEALNGDGTEANASGGRVV